MKIKEKFRPTVFEYDANYLSLRLNDNAWFDKRLAKFMGEKFEPIITEINEGTIRWCLVPSILERWTELQYNWFTQDKKLIQKMKKGHLKAGKKMEKLLNEFNTADLSKFSDKKLLSYFKKIIKADDEICIYGFSIVLVDYLRGTLTKEREARLREIVKQKRLKKRASDYFSILTYPLDETFLVREKKDMFRLALKVKKKKLKPWQADKLLESHCQNYCWITYGLSGPALTKDFFRNELNDLLAAGNIAKKLNELESACQTAKKDSAQAIRELGLTKKDKYLFDLAREILYLKGYRKEILVLSFYLAGLVVKETAKRTLIPLSLLRMLSPKEFIKAVETGKFPSLDALRERKKFMVAFLDHDVERVMIGKKAKQFFKKNVVVDKRKREVKQLNGSIASPGIARGLVKIVNTKKDMEKFYQGDILVSHQTQPDLLPAMKKAAAIVTNQGGMTCHAAIVSRELNVPCVIGTKIATKVLKDGDLVEVDAHHGIVRKVEE